MKKQNVSLKCDASSFNAAQYKFYRNVVLKCDCYVKCMFLGNYINKHATGL